MKRLLALLGLTCLSVLTACFYLGSGAAVIILIGGILLFAGSMFIPYARKEGTYPVAFVTVVVAAGIFLGYTEFFVTPLCRFDGKEAQVKAVQKEDVYYNNGYYNYTLEVKEIDNEKVSTNIKVYSKDALFTDLYDEITFKSELSYVNSGSYASKKTFLVTYLFDTSFVKVTKTADKPLMYHISSLRKSFSNSLYLEMNEESADFSNAVLLGNKHSLSGDATSLLRSAGVSHIAVVSGLHLCIIATVIRKLFSKLFRNVYLIASLTIIGIIAFVLLSGASVSVVRAAVMLIILNIGLMINRQSDSLNSLGAAALVITLSNPYSVGDIGMLLSFAATLGIVLINDKLTTPVMEKFITPLFGDYKLFYRIFKAIVSTICVTISATLATLPITILAFSGVSTVSILANLMIVPFMGVMLVVISVCIIAHYIPFAGFVCDFTAGFVSFFYDCVVFICNGLISFPYSYVYTDKPYFYYWICASLILAAIVIMFNKRFVTVISLLLSVLILFTGMLNYNIACKSKLTMHLPYTGKGISLIVESSDGYAVLKAGGYKSKYHVLSDKIARMNSYTGNVLVETPGNNSSILYSNLANEFDYSRVLRYYNKDSTNPTDSDTSQNVSEFSGIHTLNLWNKAEVVLIPSGKSVFEYIKAGDTTVLVAPKDADCSVLAAEYTCADIIITDGIPYEYHILSCDTVYVTSTGFAAEAAQEVLTSISKEVIKVHDFTFDIDL